jgi:hypothetical protein
LGGFDFDFNGKCPRRTEQSFKPPVSRSSKA